MVATSDQHGAIGESDAVRRLDRAPVVEHFGRYQAPVSSDALRAYDLVADLDLVEPLALPVSHKDEGLAGQTVTTTMLTTPIRIETRVEPEVWTGVGADDRARGVIQEPRALLDVLFRDLGRVDLDGELAEPDRRVPVDPRPRCLI